MDHLPPRRGGGAGGRWGARTATQIPSKEAAKILARMCETDGNKTLKSTDNWTKEFDYIDKIDDRMQAEKWD